MMRISFIQFLRLFRFYKFSKIRGATYLSVIECILLIQVVLHKFHRCIVRIPIVLNVKGVSPLYTFIPRAAATVRYHMIIMPLRCLDGSSGTLSYFARLRSLGGMVFRSGGNIISHAVDYHRGGCPVVLFVVGILIIVMGTCLQEARCHETL